MRILVAPQEFKGSLAAEDAADAIAAGLLRVHPGWQIDRLPLSDGGPGFIDALRRAVPADSHAAAVHDALGRRVLGRFITLRDSRTAVVEAAQANGLMHLQDSELDPLRADTAGVGELIAAALALHPRRLIVGVGGSATNDGGAGMARALGALLSDGAGRALPPGGAALADLARIDWRPPASLSGVEIVVATDVTNPLTGPDGASVTYGPQKGASPAQVDQLDAALTRYAMVLKRSLGRDVDRVPGAGAAGGLAAGLVAFLGARIESGFDIIAEATNLPARLAAADLVITGEGSFDSQSRRGKVTGRVLELARTNGKPCVVFAGRADTASASVLTLAALEPDAGTVMRDAAALLETLAATWAQSR
ncbi:MAG: glycerate kinase [Chloroflexi bacterium]|nr:glycerate kinase [Chloroflexota bacterium]